MILPELHDKKILIGLSAGINSMAVLCYLKELGLQPLELHLFYSHFVEHSPDSFRFVADGVRFARKHFNNVFFKMERNSVLSFFEKEKMIPHPTISPCSRKLKIERMSAYCFEKGIVLDLIGYVKHELKRRSEGQPKVQDAGLLPDIGLSLIEKHYPIGTFTDEWCFEIVDRNIGWHPKLYDIKDEEGKRIFKHNNCLPCKNMYPHEIEAIKIYYPEYFEKAMQLSKKLEKFWGRDKAEFYSQFGRDLGQESTCTHCLL